MARGNKRRAPTPPPSDRVLRPRTAPPPPAPTPTAPPPRRGRQGRVAHQAVVQPPPPPPRTPLTYRRRSFQQQLQRLRQQQVARGRPLFNEREQWVDADNNVPLSPTIPDNLLLSDSPIDDDNNNNNEWVPVYDYYVRPTRHADQDMDGDEDMEGGGIQFGEGDIPSDYEGTPQDPNLLTQAQLALFQRIGTVWERPVGVMTRDVYDVVEQMYRILPEFEIHWNNPDQVFRIILAMLETDSEPRVGEHFTRIIEYCYTSYFNRIKAAHPEWEQERQEAINEGDEDTVTLIDRRIAVLVCDILNGLGVADIDMPQLKFMVRLNMGTPVDEGGEGDFWRTASAGSRDFYSPASFTVSPHPEIPTEVDIHMAWNTDFETYLRSFLYDELRFWHSSPKDHYKTAPIRGVDFVIIGMDQARAAFGNCVSKNKRNEVINGITVTSYPSKNMECFISAMVHGRDNKGTNKSNTFNLKFRQFLAHRYPELAMSAKPDGRGYGLTCIPAAAEFFAVDIRVIDGNDNELATAQYLGPIETKFKHEVVELMLHNDHWYVVVGRIGVVCPRCNKKFNRRHECDYRQCQHCTKWYKNVHTRCDPSHIRHLDESAAKKDSARRLYANTYFYKEDFDVEANVIYFDMETYLHPHTKQHTPYAVGWFDSFFGTFEHAWGDECVVEFMHYLNEREDKINMAIEAGTHEAPNWGSGDHEDPKKIRPDTSKVILIGFNNSGYDNHLLLERYFANVSEVKGVNFKLTNGRLIQCETPIYRVFDVYQFLPGFSLATAAKEFGAPPAMLKGEFPHRFVTADNLDYDGPQPGLEFYFDPPASLPPLPEGKTSWNLKEQCLDYLEHDVAATRFIYTQVARMMRDKFRVDVRDYITLSQTGYAIWTSMVAPYHTKRDPENPSEKAKKPWHPWAAIGKEKWYIEIPTPDKYEFIYRSIIGGRVYPLRRDFKSKYYDEAMEGTAKWEDIRSDYLLNLDVVSLYPTAMQNYFYPCGKSDWVNDVRAAQQMFDRLKEVNKDRGPDQELDEPSSCGVWEIEYVPNKQLAVPVLARKKFVEGRVPHQLKCVELNWDLEGTDEDPITGVYTSAEIVTAMHYGYKIRLKRGLVWASREKVFAKYIKLMFQVKTEGEGVLHANHAELEGDAKWLIKPNPVLRSMGKLLMNSLYGKQLQQPIIDHTVICYDAKEFKKFTDKHKLSDLVFFDQHPTLLIAKGYDETLAGAINKPAQFGAFVLSYSRRVMEKYITICDYNREFNAYHSIVHTAQWYGDTDSIHQRIVSKWHHDTIGQYIRPGVLGMLANDYKKDEKIIRGIYLEPKTYCLTLIDKDSNIRYVIKCKGINKKHLTPEDFERALSGVHNQDVHITQIRKVGLSARSVTYTTDTLPHGFQSTNLTPFTVYSVVVKKGFYKQPWEGRDFHGPSVSTPKGYIWPSAPTVV